MDIPIDGNGKDFSFCSYAWEITCNKRNIRFLNDAKRKNEIGLRGNKSPIKYPNLIDLSDIEVIH
jgi:hypothetical protein